jgi:hypothetical protein
LANNTGGAKSTMDTRNLIYEGVKLQWGERLLWTNP